MDTFLQSSTIKRVPSHPYQVIKERILGKSYTLSLVFVGKKRALALNKINRGKNYIPNVLSFPLGTNEGEIYLCPATAVQESKKFNLSVDGYVAYLFIHGLLHLKGFDHGDTMEQQESKYCRIFNIT